jgi:hypothetical protein
MRGVGRALVVAIIEGDAAAGGHVAGENTSCGVHVLGRGTA